MIKTVANHQMTRKRSGFHATKILDNPVVETAPVIILAEDDDLLRETIALALTIGGCQVRCAADGLQAWKLLCDEPFALLITDNEMPGLIGVDLLRRMRAASFVQPVILISGNMPQREPDLLKLLSPGVALEKPFGIDQLISAMCAFVALRSKKA